MDVAVREELARIGFLLPSCESPGWDSGSQAWDQYPSLVSHP